MKIFEHVRILTGIHRGRIAMLDKNTLIVTNAGGCIISTINVDSVRYESAGTVSIRENNMRQEFKRGLEYYDALIADALRK